MMAAGFFFSNITALAQELLAQLIGCRILPRTEVGSSRIGEHESNNTYVGRTEGTEKNKLSPLHT